MKPSLAPLESPAYIREFTTRNAPVLRRFFQDMLDFVAVCQDPATTDDEIVRGAEAVTALMDRLEEELVYPAEPEL